MGGNALKNVKTSRISLINYNLIKKEIFETFQNVMIAWPYDSPNKVDFGDLDVLYQQFPNDMFDMRKYIIDIYNPQEIVSNGPVISFAYPFSKIKHLLEETIEENTQETDEEIYFQVDFIKSTNLQMSSFYFSFGDLGNILGRITKYHGLKFGDNGLFISLIPETVSKYIEENSVCKNFGPIVDLNNDVIPSSMLIGSDDIILSSDPNIICDYLGLDFNKYGDKYFTSYEKIFDWIISTPLFDKKIFTHLNYEHRHKTRTRPMYNKFVEYIGLQVNEIKTNEFLEESDKTTTKTSDKTIEESVINIIKADNHIKALTHFNKTFELENIILHNAKKKIRSDKFNGKKLIAYGIDKKEIGKYIQIFHNYVVLKYVTDFNEWLDNNTISTIDEALASCLLLYSIKLNQ